jgi:hypothetical protein
VARKGNFGFEKRQKELKRKKKAEAKLERRRAARKGANDTDGAGESGTSDEETSEAPETSVR